MTSAGCEEGGGVGKAEQVSLATRKMTRRQRGG